MNKRLLWALGIFVLSLVVYTLTLCPTIYWEDSAAFATAANTLGIPNSPGFPIYVLLGRLFTFFQINNPAWPVNLMSAFWGSLSLALLFFLLFKVSNPEQGKTSFTFAVTAASSVLFLGFTNSFWSQTFRAEVYTLNFLFTVLLLLSLLKWSDSRSKNQAEAPGYFMLFAFLWGLSATNHSLLALSLAPALLVFIAVTDFKFLTKLSNLITALFFGLVGITPYLFLLIRSQQNPALNWGRPDTWENLLKVMTRSDSWHGSINIFQVNLWNNFIQLSNFVLSELFLPVILLSLLGAVLQFRRQKKILLLLAGVFICNILVVTWAAEFSLRNLDLFGYLLPGLMTLVIWATMGTLSVFELVRKYFQPYKWKSYSPALASVLILLPLFQLCQNLKANNRSGNYFAYRYGKQILDQVPVGSVIITTEDNTLTPLWYLTLVESYRPDVIPLAWSLLDNLDYLKNIRLQHSGLSMPARLPKEQWVEKFVQLNQKVPLFVQYGDLRGQTEKALAPAGYLLRYSQDAVDLQDKYLPGQYAFLQQLFEDLEARPNLDLITKEHFGNFFFNWGVYFDRHGLPEQSLLNFNRALQIDQTNDRYFTALGKGFLKSGRIEQAEKFFMAAVELNPYEPENYEYLSQCKRAKPGG